FVALAGRNSVGEIDFAQRTLVKEFSTQRIPFEVRLSEDEKTLIVSNWGGRIPIPGDRTAKSDNTEIAIDAKGAPASGTVSTIDRHPGKARHVDVGIHPTAIAVKGSDAFVACAMSDEVAVIDWTSAKLLRSIPIRFGSQRLLGSMPNAVALRGNTLLVANGG